MRAPRAQVDSDMFLFHCNHCGDAIGGVIEIKKKFAGRDRLAPGHSREADQSALPLPKFR